MSTASMEKSAAKVVSPSEWLVARKQLLAKEKEFTRLRDELSRERREMPMEKVEKKYVFETVERKRDVERFVSGPQPVDRVSLYVWPRLAGGMPQLLLPCGFV